MTNTFELKKGKIVFEEDKMTISDNGKNQKYSKLFSSCIFVGLTIFNLFDYAKHDKDITLFTAILFGLGGIVMLVNFFRTDASSEIFLKDVKSMKVKRILFKEFLIIKLNNNKIRRVAEIFNPERLEEHIKTISIPK